MNESVREIDGLARCREEYFVFILRVPYQITWRFQKKLFPQQKDISVEFIECFGKGMYVSFKLFVQRLSFQKYLNVMYRLIYTVAWSAEGETRLQKLTK